MTIYNKTSNGSVFKCATCSSIHLEFNNLNINFSTEEKYQQFVEYIHEIDVDSAERTNASLPYQRKIAIPIGGGGCNFVLHSGELEDLKRLCISRLGTGIVNLSALEIDFSLN